jgi:hypothetical protein
MRQYLAVAPTYLSCADRKVKTSFGTRSGGTMASWRRRIFAAAVAVAVPLFVSNAQAVTIAPPRPLGRLLGVFDDATGQPVGSAEVLDLATRRKSFTSVSGAVSLARLDPGVTVLQIRKIGYASRMQTVSVTPADTVSITMLLKPLAQELPEVRTTAPNTTTGKLATFERHRASGMGHFLTTEQLAKVEGHLTSDVFRTIPGVKVWPDGRSTAWYVASTRGSGSIKPGICLAAVMVDGVMVYRGTHGQAPFDINSIRPEEMAAVEFYAGGASMPIEYRAGCALVVIWTR